MFTRPGSIDQHNGLPHTALPHESRGMMDVEPELGSSLLFHCAADGESTLW